MSLSKPIPDHRYSEEFENGRPSGVRRMPIACWVCNRVSFDNVSLVLHLEVHVKDGVRVRGRDLASMRSDQHSSSSWSPCSYSSLAKVFQTMYDCLRSCPSAPRDPNLLCIPVLNVSQPIMTSSSTCPSVYSQADPRNFDYGEEIVAPPLRELDGGHKNQEIIVISNEVEDEN